MIVSPDFVVLDSYPLAAARDSVSLQQYRPGFAKQHRNNAAGQVFAAAARLPLPPTAKGREYFPALLQTGKFETAR
jgi:hypothetical protein